MVETKRGVGEAKPAASQVLEPHVEVFLREAVNRSGNPPCP